MYFFHCLFNVGELFPWRHKPNSCICLSYGTWKQQSETASLAGSSFRKCFDDLFQLVTMWQKSADVPIPGRLPILTFRWLLMETPEPERKPNVPRRNLWDFVKTVCVGQSSLPPPLASSLSVDANSLPGLCRCSAGYWSHCGCNRFHFGFGWWQHKQ